MMTQMIFDEELKHVRLHYSMVYEGGHAFLKREGDQWILQSVRRTWIQ